MLESIRSVLLDLSRRLEQDTSEDLIDYAIFLDHTGCFPIDECGTGLRLLTRDGRLVLVKGWRKPKILWCSSRARVVVALLLAVVLEEDALPLELLIVVFTVVGVAVVEVVAVIISAVSIRRWAHSRRMFGFMILKFYKTFLYHQAAYMNCGPTT